MSKRNINKYAPILIPTLNRYEHLKRCIDSLQNNTGAEYTDLYISVDYPPREEYIKGWREVIEYVDSGITGFANVYIYKQKSNLGPYENELFLKKQIEQKYDSYIFSEDDNEFFPCFIDYINKGINKYQNDDEIFAICASGATLVQYKNTPIIKSCDFSPYGYGSWIEKEKRMIEKVDKNYFIEKAKKSQNYIRLFKYDWGLFFAFVSLLMDKEEIYKDKQGNIAYIDMVEKMYLFFENKYSIFPYKQLVYNYGNDGSGQNCPERYVPERAKSVYDCTNSKVYDFEHVDNVKLQHHQNKEKKGIWIYIQYFVCRIQIRLFLCLGEEKFRKIYKKIKGLK